MSKCESSVTEYLTLLQETRCDLVILGLDKVKVDGRDFLLLRTSGFGSDDVCTTYLVPLISLQMMWQMPPEKNEPLPIYTVLRFCPPIATDDQPITDVIIGRRLLFVKQALFS